MINLLTGRQTDNLQEEIIRRAIECYRDDEDKLTFIIVPNHIKFTTEIDVLSTLNSRYKKSSVKNLQVLSFSRLAWFFLKNEKINFPEILDDAGSVMLLKQIVEENKDNLLIFKDSEVNNGSLKQVYEAMLSIKQGNLDLEEIDEDGLGDKETKRKIHDLKLIYHAFSARLSDKFATKDEVENLLNKFLMKAKNLKEMNFFFVDFSHFTSQELKNVQLISTKANNITFAFKTKDGTIKKTSQVGDYDYIVQKTIKQLKASWFQQGLEVKEEAFLSKNKISKAEKLNGLWVQELPPFKDSNEFKDFTYFIKADSRYAEAYFVARTIYQQVALHNYRYRDFLVLAPNLSEYETYLAPIMRQNKIPFFNDLQKQMKYHPLVVVIESLRKIAKGNFSTTNILAFAKTKLFLPDWYQTEQQYQEDLDNLENFVLAHGINFSLWERPLTDFVDANVIKLDNAQEKVQTLDKLRTYLLKTIKTIIEQLKQVTEVEEGINKFWNFLVENHVPERFEQWRKQAIDTGDLQLAQEPEQVWSTLQTLIKDYLLIAKEYDLDSFFDLLISGFGEASFSQIPSTLDAVNISELGMVQIPKYKQVFILGATSTNLPQLQTTPGFLSSENIEEINNTITESENQLEDSHKVNNLDQNYQFGNVLSLASDKIYFSYPILNASNEKMQPSLYYKELCRLTEQPEKRQRDLPVNQEEVLSFVTNPKASLGYLTYMKNNNFSYAQALVELTSPKEPELAQHLILSSEFKNVPEDLSEELAQELYGQTIETSISQLETYYKNSFEYFLNYGLRLHKRVENELDVIQAGNYYHETFDNLVKYLKAHHLDLAGISIEQLYEILREIQLELQKKGQYRQLLNDPFNQYLFKRLDSTTNYVANFWHNHLNQTLFRPQYSELSFGSSQKVKGLKFEVPDFKGKMHQVGLRGKIDRIDLAQIDDQTIAQLIDYKSSEKNFEMNKFFSGISLQMMSYLDVLNKNAGYFADGDKPLKIMGAFYQTIANKRELINKKTNIQKGFKVKDLKAENRKQVQYRGILVKDLSLLKEIEPTLAESRKSDFYNGVQLNKDQTFSKRKGKTVIFSPNQLDKLLEYNDFLIKQAAQKILSGKIALNPFRDGKNTALKYSDYKDIFFFDPMLPENEYHDLPTIKDSSQLIDEIDKKLGKKDNDE
ncbi:PD-(D/E)XK nuclease family protein [Lactobacillus sp. PV012]|uniref:PD-(D/E)XK nuclease family protein n=1 Tax=Lactobacillus sp. PV012 TaxID=2594494 RepID=UPI0022406468|nr:PD-(D/E)XK nuclease family protein [Lactobacillus sp. PV012]QNQ82307.1 ATP-dependent helicase [Lactobacillus sp. PV012]